MSRSESPRTAAPAVLFRARDTTHSTRAVRTGRLYPVLRGVYAAGTEWASLAPWDKFLTRVHAAHLRHPDSVFFLEAAAVVHGLPIFGDPGDVHVLGDSERRSRLSAGIHVHTTTEPRALTMVGGLRVPSIADTVVDMARARHPAIALAVADAALRLDPLVSVESLVALNEARASSRGRKRARWVLHRASPLSESPLESVDRAVIEWLGFPEPELQVWIGSDRVDKWWPAHKIAGEGDGDGKYERSSDVRAMLSERHRRDARLIAAGAVSVPHWGWPEALAADPLFALLTTAGLPVVHPRNTAQLSSLARTLRRPAGSSTATTQPTDENPA